MATTRFVLLSLAALVSYCHGHQQNHFKPSLEVQNSGNDKPISKDQHLSRRRSKKTFVDRHENMIGVDAADVDDDYEKDHLGLYKYTETYNSGSKTTPVKPVPEVNQTSTYHYIHHPPSQNQGDEVASPFSNVPRLTRIFGGFLKDSKTKLEGRVYNTFNNQFCQFKEDLCEWVFEHILPLRILD